MARKTPVPPVAAEFGERVRRRRERHGWSQMDLAERAGMHFSFVSSIERGQRNVTLTSILKIAQGLGVDPAVLIKGLRVDL